jgi:hypothetical protein
MFRYPEDAPDELQTRVEDTHKSLAEQHGPNNVAVFSDEEAVVVLVGEGVGTAIAETDIDVSVENIPKTSVEGKNNIPSEEHSLRYHLYDDFPQEIADFALDNVEEQLWWNGNHDARTLFEMGYITTDSERGQLNAEMTVVGEAIRSLLLEKITEVENELNNGERDDFSIAELEKLHGKAVELTPSLPDSE